MVKAPGLAVDKCSLNFFLGRDGFILAVGLPDINNFAQSQINLLMVKGFCLG
jgi:hypothetical protein